MTLRCKPGVHAYVIKTIPEHSDCLGRVVQVIRMERGQNWLVHFEGEPPASIRPYSDALSEDQSLLPITGLPDDEIAERKIVKNQVPA